MYKKLDITYYLELQRRFEEIILFVSLHEENFNTYSIKIENLFVDTCTFFDSLCQTLIINFKKNGHVFQAEGNIRNFNKKIMNQEYFNINDYREILENEYRISDFEINLNCHIDDFVGNPIYYFDQINRSVNFKLIKPFASWANSINPDWWGSYTSLKHNRLDNIKLGNMKNLTYALAGIFIILTLRNEGTFKTAKLDKEVYNVFFPNYWQFNGISTSRGNVLLC